MNRGGQFYLIAAIVIVAVIIGFAAVSNTSKRNEVVKIYDLGEELGIESSAVLDYGTVNPDEIDLEDFSEQYNDYAEVEGRDMFFIFGGLDGVTIISYQEVLTGTINLGGQVIQITETQGVIQNQDPRGNTIEVEIKGTTYTFELKEGENFYFLIQQEVGEEKHVIQG